MAVPDQCCMDRLGKCGYRPTPLCDLERDAPDRDQLPRSPQRGRHHHRLIRCEPIAQQRPPAPRRKSQPPTYTTRGLRIPAYRPPPMGAALGSACCAATLCCGLYLPPHLWTWAQVPHPLFAHVPDPKRPRSRARGRRGGGLVVGVRGVDHRADGPSRDGPNSPVRLTRLE